MLKNNAKCSHSYNYKRNRSYNGDTITPKSGETPWTHANIKIQNKTIENSKIINTQTIHHSNSRQELPLDMFVLL